MFMNRLRLSPTRHQPTAIRRHDAFVVMGRFERLGRLSSLLLAFVLLLPATPLLAQPAQSDEAKQISDRLPDGYVPPPERMPIMDLNQPIADKDEMKKLKAESVTFTKVKATCDLTPAGRKIVESYIRLKLAEMTVKDEKEGWNKLPSLHKRFIENEISPVSSPTRRPAEIEQMNRLIGDTVIKQIPELLKNNFEVRVHAVQILSEMDYGPASGLLLQVLQAKDITEDPVEGQPEPIKIEAALGLVRMVRFSIASAKERTAIAQAIVAELRNPDIFWWRQLRYVEILRYCDIPGVELGNNDKPFVVDSLVEVVRDKRRPLRVRTRACYALGRVPLPRTVKSDDVVNAVMECALDLCNEAIAKPKDLHLKRCFTNIYAAFQTCNSPKEKDLDTEKKGPGGLLVRASAASKPAYQVFLPIFSDAVQKTGAAASSYIDKPPTAENMRKLTDFVRARQPNMQANQQPAKPAAPNAKFKPQD